jgi:hypothetical protein
MARFRFVVYLAIAGIAGLAMLQMSRPLPMTAPPAQRRLEEPIGDRRERTPILAPVPGEPMAGESRGGDGEARWR